LIKWIINGSSVPGFSFIASAIALFSGVQLIALGMIGEYLARMYLRIMEQPPYVIRNKTP
jgi:undecaprenyl-phosphate 4-deoxy-4-formamido-L-arabinose transferase